MTRKLLVLLGLAAVALAVGLLQWRPAPDEYDAGAVGETADGRVMVPTNQILEPAGRQLLFPGRPNDCVLSPDGKLLAVKEAHHLVILDLAAEDVTAALQTLHTYAGILFLPDGRTVLTGDTSGQVRTAAVGSDGKWEWGKPLRFAAKAPAKSAIPVGLALSPDGGTFWAVLNGNNTLAQWDLRAGRLVREVRVGQVPFGVALVPGGKAYVTNWGGRIPGKGDLTAGAPHDLIVVDPRTNAAASGTVSVVDCAKGVVTRTLEVGLHPSAILANPAGTRVYVANTHSDTVSVIDTARDAVVEVIPVAPKDADHFGSSPAALALSPGGDVLYVANATNNAVAVVALSGAAGSSAARAPARSEVRGFIPTGWYPAGLALSRDGGTLYVANIKGTGLRDRVKGHFNARGHMGSISVIPVPDARTLAAYTRRVARNNRMRRMEWVKQAPRRGVAPRPVPERVGEPSLFEHVVYIIKENHTYDNIFGDIERANGAPEICLFGRDVTPNQHKLADEFLLMDNYYCSGKISADGHQWTDEGYCTDTIERSFGHFVRSYPFDGGDAMAYSPTGFLWDNALAHGKSFRNYGEMVKATITGSGTWKELNEGLMSGDPRFKVRATANVASLRGHTCPTYPGFPLKIMDLYRAGEFLKELKQFEERGRMPNLIMMLLPNDHTAGTTPGHPTPRAQVADNDLALGMIIEGLTRSKFWPKTVVFVTEDDPQNGLDHVDGHRTLGLVISPYSRMGGRVVRTHYNQISMLRTIEQILGLPPMNQLDALATPMADCFTDTLDPTPYTRVPNQVPLDEMNPPKQALGGKALHWATVSEGLPLDEPDKCDDDTLNRIIWHSVRGVDTPYPTLVGR